MSEASVVDIDVWSDFSCVWCWFSQHRLGQALDASTSDFRITVHSFQIDPDGPTRSVPSVDNLAQKTGVTRDAALALEEDMAQRAHSEGLAYRPQRFHTNGFDAHRVVHLAREFGVAEELFDDLQAALWARGEDIYAHPFLTWAAVARGIPRDRVAQALRDHTYAELVRADIAEARARGITAVPFVLVDRKVAVPGAASVAGYRAALERVGA
jgi:predicted DsbA family dithiol-disulfide isomerase